VECQRGSPLPYINKAKGVERLEAVPTNLENVIALLRLSIVQAESYPFHVLAYAQTHPPIHALVRTNPLTLLLNINDIPQLPRLTIDLDPIMQEFLKASRVKDIIIGRHRVIDIEFVESLVRPLGGFGGSGFGLEGREGWVSILENRYSAWGRGTHHYVYRFSRRFCKTVLLVGEDSKFMKCFARSFGSAFGDKRKLRVDVAH
jgi:hypothetical protein